MKHTIQRLWLLIAVPVSLIIGTACSDTPETTPVEKKKADEKRTVVGRIASIPASRTFVLIQSYGTWTIANGTILTTQGPDGRSANLRVTGEKLGQYAAADIQSGTLEVGDGVYTVITPPDQLSTDPSDSVSDPSIPTGTTVYDEEGSETDQSIPPTSPQPAASE